MDSTFRSLRCIFLKNVIKDLINCSDCLKKKNSNQTFPKPRCLQIACLVRQSEKLQNNRKKTHKMINSIILLDFGREAKIFAGCFSNVNICWFFINWIILCTKQMKRDFQWSKTWKRETSLIHTVRIWSCEFGGIFNYLLNYLSSFHSFTL